LFKTNHLFTYSNAAAFINYAATSATGFLMSLYLQYIKDFSPQDTGLILVTQPIVMMVFSAAAGWLSDKIESRIIASFGMIISAASLLLFIFITENSPLYFIISALALLGFGIALFASPNTNAIMSSVEKKYYGVASATVGTMRLTGQMISIGIAALIFSLFMGTAQISPENHGAFLESIKTAFSIFAVLCFIGIFASLARGNKNKN
jgi:MFS family permease